MEDLNRQNICLLNGNQAFRAHDINAKVKSYQLTQTFLSEVIEELLQTRLAQAIFAYLKLSFVGLDESNMNPMILSDYFLMSNLK